MKKLFFVFLLAVQVFNGLAQSSPSPVYRKHLDSLINANADLRVYATLGNCERIDYLDSIGHSCGLVVCNNRGVNLMIKDIEYVTGIDSKYKPWTGGFLGSYYKNPFDFDDDLKAWRGKIKCKSSKKYYFDKALQDSLHYYNSLKKPSHVDLLKRGIINYKFKIYDKAISDFEQSLKVKPNYADALNARGKYNLEMTRDYKKAIEDFSSAIKINSKYTKAYVNRAIAYTELKEYQNAMESIDLALTIEPSNLDALYHKAFLVEKQDKLEDAFSLYSRVISLQPNFADAYYSRGMVGIQLGRNEDACKDFTTALHLGMLIAQEKLNESCK